jgi:hypothetical protein
LPREPDAKSAIGLVNDADFLKKAFAAADAVFTITPPNMGGTKFAAKF